MINNQYYSILETTGEVLKKMFIIVDKVRHEPLVKGQVHNALWSALLRTYGHIGSSKV